MERTENVALDSEDCMRIADAIRDDQYAHSDKGLVLTFKVVQDLISEAYMMGRGFVIGGRDVYPVKEKP